MITIVRIVDKIDENINFKVDIKYLYEGSS